MIDELIVKLQDLLECDGDFDTVRNVLNALENATKTILKTS